MSSADLDVARIAKLARLELTDAEIAEFQGEIAEILTHVEKLSEVDVSGIEPTAHAVPITNVVRDDVVGTCLDRKDVLANAPATAEGDLIRVPVVIGGDSA
jgi:aspartyl-tRNA(Asn)/glutamyl-tRNA(Gln) amidotransferase subunit C